MATAYEDNLACAVCLDLYDDPRFLPCGHSFCLKCLLDLQNKSSNKCVMKCPVCQAESSCEDGGQASYTKNYELNNLVQSFILESKAKDTICDAYLCDICDCDPQARAQRACTDCDMMYCETCFNTCHPMKGKLKKHKIVNADENFKCAKNMNSDDKNMYCNDCDTLITVADINNHIKHEVVSLEKAHMIFKVKLEEATGSIDLMESTLKSLLDKSKEKLKLVETIFEEIEREMIRKKEELLSKLKADVKEAEAAIYHVMPAISTHRELQSRASTISFIEECQNIILHTSLKQDFNDVRLQLEKIDILTCKNEAVIIEIKKLELCVVPETNGPSITKVSDSIKGREKNRVVLEWTTVQNAESYNILSKVKESTVHVGLTSDTSYVLDNIDGTSATELWVTAMVNGRESLQSASVMVPTVIVPSVRFDHQRAGSRVRVSTDGLRTAYDVHAAELLGAHHPACKAPMPYTTTVLGNPRMTAGRVYWELEAAHAARDECSCSFGVTSSATPADCEPGEDAASWAVWLDCGDATTTISMYHAGKELQREDSAATSGHRTHRYGLLLDIDARSLSVIHVMSNKIVYIFMNVDASHGVTPVFDVYNYKCTLRLVDPDEIQRVPLPFSTAAVV